MKTVPLDLSEAASYEALELFLEGVRSEAENRARSILLSISMPSDYLDPLAVLESIYESNELHFYVERRSDGFAIAGAESAIAYHPKGDERFGEAKKFIADTLENTVAVGDERLSAFGPHFFCAFGFFSEAKEGAAFPASTVFVPLWQVAARDGGCVAIANVLVEPKGDVSVIAQRIWNANSKLKAINENAGIGVVSNRDAWRVLEENEVDTGIRFEDSVQKALEQIKAGVFDKVVVARALDICANQAFHPLEILNTLRETYPDCFAFSVANGKNQSFIGASPERLVSVKSDRLFTEALAGSAPRGSTAGEDAAYGNGLLKSVKDRHEQALVLESIVRRLDALGFEVNTPREPRLKRLKNVQHLHTPIEADVPENVSIFDVLEQLHPTPAVGGSPRETACEAIPALEGFDRGLYAGAIGWVDSSGEGEFLVSIRSALIDGEKARLYAGVGIVDGSDAAKERKETDLKFRALKQNLL